MRIVLLVNFCCTPFAPRIGPFPHGKLARRACAVLGWRSRELKPSLAVRAS
jgi:hypothetical protein